MRRPAFHVFVFVLGLLSVSWPLLDISARGGIVSLYAYLFEVWLALVALLILIGGALRDGGDSAGK